MNFFYAGRVWPPKEVITYWETSELYSEKQKFKIFWLCPSGSGLQYTGTFYLYVCNL